MLKIKDNVDLKELIKYGFTTKMYEPFEYIFITNGLGIFEKNPDRRIEVRNGFDIVDLEILYDLIKDGLVEKVEG